MFELFSVIKALIVRSVLILHVILCTWRVTVTLDNDNYWLLLCILLLLVCESFYTIIRRKGKEFARFTPCFFFYLGAVLPGIWLLELDQTDQAIAANSSVQRNKSDPFDIKVPGATRTIWLIVIEEMMPYVIFISRWILPRGKVTRTELAELLFSFLSIGADIMEFFSLIGVVIIRKNKTLVCAVLAIWSFSVLQFTMTVTVIHNPKSEKSVRVVPVMSKEQKEWWTIKHEIFAIFLTLAMQDVPFAVIRLYTIINFNYIEYGLIFFTCKNLLIIVLMLYKVAVLCITRYYPEEDDEDDNDKDIYNPRVFRKHGRASVRENVYVSSQSMFVPIKGKSDSTFGMYQLRHKNAVRDFEKRLEKQQFKHRQRNQTSRDLEAVSARISDTFMYGYDAPFPTYKRPAPPIVFDGYRHIAHPDVYNTRNTHRNGHANGRNWNALPEYHSKALSEYRPKILSQYHSKRLPEYHSRPLSEYHSKNIPEYHPKGWSEYHSNLLPEYHPHVLSDYHSKGLPGYYPRVLPDYDSKGLPGYHTKAFQEYRGNPKPDYHPFQGSMTFPRAPSYYSSTTILDPPLTSQKPGQHSRQLPGSPGRY